MLENKIYNFKFMTNMLILWLSLPFKPGSENKIEIHVSNILAIIFMLKMPVLFELFCWGFQGEQNFNLTLGLLQS